MAVEAWFDGACNNVGDNRSGYGALVKAEGAVIFRAHGCLGAGPHLSNNCAEYAGIIALFRFFIQSGITVATVYGDSDLVIGQLTGRVKVKRGRYLPFFEEARTLFKQLPGVSLKWISREQNSEADELSQIGIRSQKIESILPPRANFDLLFA